jgi:hypothetical protein
MIKRIAALPLWYLATVSVYFALADLTGTPRVLGFLVGACVAIFVFADPAHLFWAPSSPRRTETPTTERQIAPEAHRAA